MATAKKSPIQTAVDLLKKNGYTVTKKRADPRIGDVVRFRDLDMNVLITLHDPASTNYKFGGVVISKRTVRWIDRNEWAKDDGQYEVIGHVNLDKYVKE